MTELQKFYKEHHICIDCGQDDAVPGQLRCYYCRSSHRDADSKYHDKHKEKRNAERRARYRAEYAERVQKGLCTRCGKRKPSSNRKICERCLAMRRNNENKRNRENGVLPRNEFGNGLYCSKCGRKVEKYGDKLCVSCYTKACKSLEKARACVTKTKGFYKPFIFGRKEHENDTGS